MINQILSNQYFKLFSANLTLAFPFTVLYNFFPEVAFSVFGIILYSFLLGLYIFRINYKIAKNQVKALLYAPSGDYIEYFKQEVQNCNLDFDKLLIRYAYVGDSIAMSTFNLVILDPIIFKNIADPELLKVCDIVEKHIIPTVPNDKKILLDAINYHMSPEAQKFIFRHELGHFFYNYSYKKLFLNSLIIFIISNFALVLAKHLILNLPGALTLLICLILSCIADLFLAYVSNYFFKSREEYKADLFAVKYSSKLEIQAAADFFEQYEYAARQYRQATNPFSNLIPTKMLIGYTDGISRAKYLRDMATNKL